MSSGERKRRCYLTTAELHRLDLAVAPLVKVVNSPLTQATDHGFGVYLVGSTWDKADYRDVDVRMILSDEGFDALFGHCSALWEAFCYAWSRLLTHDTELPVDFQVQRQTEANEKYGGHPRNPLGTGHREFADLGDATKFLPPVATVDLGGNQ